MLSAKDEKYYIDAMKIAELSECDSRHGALVVRGGNPLAYGVNRYRSHPVSRKYSGFDKCTIHAEQRALILARTDLRGATLYSARANGTRTSRPCRMCSELIREAGIKFVVFYTGTEVIKERV